MLIFKKVETAIKQVYAQKSQETEAAGLAVLEKELSLLKEISEYIKEGSWLSRKPALERLLVILKKGPEAAMKQYDCTRESINSTLTGYSRRLEKLIGVDTIDLILHGEVEKARMQFYTGTNQVALEKLIAEEVMESFPESAFNDTNLSSCMTEFKMLKVVSKAYLTSLYKKVDVNKLAYIRYIMESMDSDFAQDKIEIYKFLTGESNDVAALEAYLQNRVDPTSL